MQPRIELYDTTLRDGAQREGISLSVNDKIRISRLADELGVGFIEGGWPGSNPKDAQYFQRVRDLSFSQAKLAVFGSTIAPEVVSEEPEALADLFDSGADVATLVGKTWTTHVHNVLQVSLQENLAMIHATIRACRLRGLRVFFDAEHFFDGYLHDPEYACSCLRSAVEAGAERVILCDTNGGCMPWQVEEITVKVVHATPVGVGIHSHNDSELAVANALAAVRAGAIQVQGTLNGYGERVGNCNLLSVIANLSLHLGIDCLRDEQLQRLTEISQVVAEICNLAPDNHQPFVGASAFVHKGGIHADATLKDAQSYQHIDPRRVGNQTRVLISELSGKGNLLFHRDQLGLDRLDPIRAKQVVAQIKKLEAQGFSYEAAQASVTLLALRARPDYQQPFELIDFLSVTEHRQGRGVLAEANVKIRIKNSIMHTAAEGCGPVHALDQALRKALEPAFPQVAEFRLCDYKVRILDSNTATSATTRVLIDTDDGRDVWTTVGCSSNIIDASWQALVDSIEYGLHKSGALTQPNRQTQRAGSPLRPTIMAKRP